MFVTTYYLKKEFTEDVGVDWVNNEEEEVLKVLDKVVAIYLSQYFEKLLGIMYRIDVDEQNFRRALQSEKPSFAIAKLVLEREKKRIEIREKYNNSDKN